MPYNNTPIAPSKEVTGHVSLPLARVQKIINADPERLNVSKNAAFAIALATEMFIQHLATTTHNVVKAERKPRRNIQYRDVSSAVAKTDNLEFAVDVVPRTVAYKEFRKKLDDRERSSAKDKGKGKQKATTLEGDVAEKKTGALKEHATTNGHVKASVTPAANVDHTPDAMDVDPSPEQVEDSEPEDDPAAMQLEMEMRGPPRPVASPEAPRSGGFTAINGSR